jgi:enterochelin esterase-like enzyme
MKFLYLLLCLFININLMAQLPKVVAGKIDRISAFPSTYVSNRNVDVWLPDGYSAEKKYNVLYMHDGQMLFDSASTWNKLA